MKGKVTREIGNVIWLRGRETSPTDAVASLKRTVAALAREIEWSHRLRTEIASAVRERRYEIYKGSVIMGRDADTGLARAQDLHLSTLLRFIHAIAAAGSDEQPGECRPAARFDRLAASIRELRASLTQAQQLSRDMLRQSRQRG